ncbi:hypothetical protein BI364_09520 [Acidihalobacter yilgarnensis]|uniref:Uncharacterized protein n=1 Tax=Acidihalobacter yilgarnensis TaxID=2819280 RepID=A0A1D8INU8_9GAMM|nr:hypothetical protein [Acidihalobacter yilgarnensis]AOU98153.1 hypothetical protein BI364_09460 [Acidihalobacter yilgarnensis]AOU98163.1 hypothetical protein BI364_09520 [Acidihalobacter yilgarnensis]
MHEIKQAAETVNQKREELQIAQEKLADVKTAAQLPQAARTRVEQMLADPRNDPANLVRIYRGPTGGAQTYELHERIEQPAEDDILERLRQQLQAEVGNAHLEDRTPDVAEINAEIREIEGARAAMAVQQARVASLSNELAQLEKILADAVIEFARSHFDAGRTAYRKSLDATLNALTMMAAANALGSQWSARGARAWPDQIEPYLNQPNRPQHQPVDFRAAVTGDAFQRARGFLINKLTQLGVEI